MERSKRNWFMLILGVIFFITFAYATTTITDDFIGMDDGDIIGVQNLNMNQGMIKDLLQINLTGTPLLISDSNDSRLIALFNVPQGIIFTSAQNEIDLPPNFTGGSTAFFGQVNNFDNFNGFSRFIETNINNGTGAASAFTAVNDIGWNVSIAIGSSNFGVPGVERPNGVAIASRSPADFNFANAFNTGFIWRSNQITNDTNPINVRNIMNLTTEGNLDIINNYSGTQITLDIQEPKPTCEEDIQGTIVYEGNGSSGDFFGCKRQNMNTFSWSKFS